VSQSGQGSEVFSISVFAFVQNGRLHTLHIHSHLISLFDFLLYIFTSSFDFHDGI
jgi:hypothetical protein